MLNNRELRERFLSPVEARFSAKTGELIGPTRTCCASDAELGIQLGIMVARIDVLQASLGITFRITGIVRCLIGDENLDHSREDDTVFSRFPYAYRSSPLPRHRLIRPTP
jgi:hypothetical protein